MTPADYIRFCRERGVRRPALRNLKLRPDLAEVRTEAISLMLDDGMAQHEIAEMMGIPETTASQAIRKIRESRPAVSTANRMATDPDSPKKLRLVKDPYPNRNYDRRREDCAYLRACEWDWIEVRGSEQAACPRACPDFANREPEAAE